MEALDRPYVKHLRVSGITQANPLDSADPVPRDPQKARIGSTFKSPSKDFAQFQPVNMLNPEKGNGRNRQIGYMVHTSCWVLLDRAIGQKLVEANLRVFLNAVKQFWKENSEIWNYTLPEEYDDDPFYSAPGRTIEEQQTGENGLAQKKFAQTGRCAPEPSDCTRDTIISRSSGSRPSGR